MHFSFPKNIGKKTENTKIILVKSNVVAYIARFRKTLSITCRSGSHPEAAPTLLEWHIFQLSSGLGKDRKFRERFLFRRFVDEIVDLPLTRENTLPFYIQVH